MKRHITSLLMAGILLTVLGGLSSVSAADAPKRFLVYKATSVVRDNYAELQYRDAAAGLVDKTGGVVDTERITFFLVVDVDTDDEMKVTYSNRRKEFEVGGFTTPEFKAVTIPIRVGRKAVKRKFFHYGFSAGDPTQTETFGLTSLTGIGVGNVTNIRLPALPSVGENRLVEGPARITQSTIQSWISKNESFRSSHTNEFHPGDTYYLVASKTSKKLNGSMTAIANGRYGNLRDEDGVLLTPGSQEYVEVAIAKYFLDRKFSE